MMLDEDVYYSLDLGSNVERIEYSFERYDNENHAIDVYILDDFNSQQFDDENSFLYVGDLSSPATKSVSFSNGPVWLEPDKYHLIVDNSDMPDAEPPSDGENNVVHFNVDVTIYKCD